MTKGAAYRLCEGICVTIITVVMCMRFFVPTFYIKPDFGTVILVDFIWVISFILPAIFSYLDCEHAYSDAATGIALAGAYLTSFLIMCWVLDTRSLEMDLKTGILFFIIGPIFAAIINFIPLGTISWMIIISNPGLFYPTQGGIPTGDGEEGNITSHKSYSPTKAPESEFNHTGYMNNDVAGHNSVFNNNSNDFKLDYYKINDTDFALVHEKLFGRTTLEFHKVKNKGYFDHDYDVITDTGKRYYADINPMKGLPGCADLFVYIDGRRIELFYKELPQF